MGGGVAASAISAGCAAGIGSWRSICAAAPTSPNLPAPFRCGPSPRKCNIPFAGASAYTTAAFDEHPPFSPPRLVLPSFSPRRLVLPSPAQSDTTTTLVRAMRLNGELALPRT